MNRSRIFLLCSTLLVSGCLRYTPSRSEIAARDKSIEIQEVSLADFAKNESERAQALRQFVQQRKQQFVQSRQHEYHIGPGDQLEVSVFGLPELDSTPRVQPDGTITLPILDTVPAARMTPAKLQFELARRLQPYVISPRVKVTVQEHNSQRVSIVGAVERPGMYSLEADRTTLLDVLSLAGGRTETAGSRLVLYPAQRSENASIQAASLRPVVSGDASGRGFEFFLDELQGSSDHSPMLVPLLGGDTIFVPEAGSVQVDGDVKKPGTYPLSRKMSLLGAVAAAGGLRYSANVREVEVIRDLAPGQKAAVVVDLEQVALQAGADFRLKDGDIVRIPSSSGRFAGEQVAEFINGLLSVGVSSTP